MDKFDRASALLLKEVETEIGWMYETQHSPSVKGRINYTVWSEVFACPNCSGEIVFVTEALDPETKRVRESFACPQCNVDLGRRDLDRSYESFLDPVHNKAFTRPKRRPVFINYSAGGKTFEKEPDEADKEVLSRVEAMPYPMNVPTHQLPYMHMTHERARLDKSGITHLHHFFLPRAAHAMALLWRKANHHPDPRTRHMLLWFVEQAIWGLSVLNRYQPIQQGKPGGSQVNRQLTGVYYIPSQIAECSPTYNLGNRAGRLVSNAFVNRYQRANSAIITTGTAANLPVPPQSIDDIFTDPPFGENIYYADLNFLVEAWHRVTTQAACEAIVDRAKHKDVYDYEALMHAVFREYHPIFVKWISKVVAYIGMPGHMRAYPFFPSSPRMRGSIRFVSTRNQ